MTEYCTYLRKFCLDNQRNFHILILNTKPKIISELNE